MALRIGCNLLAGQVSAAVHERFLQTGAQSAPENAPESASRQVSGIEIRSLKMQKVAAPQGFLTTRKQRDNVRRPAG
jgi:hypothetical protein